MTMDKKDKANVQWTKKTNIQKEISMYNVELDGEWL